MEREDRQFATVKELLQFTNERGLGSRTEMQILAATCGLLDKSQNEIRLSETGHIIAQLSTSVQPDIVHYLLYSGWSKQEPAENTMLWSYRQVADSLWERSSVDVLDFASRLVEVIHNRIRQEFVELSIYDLGAESFSKKSVLGARKWLEALSPPVIEGDSFNRRHFCAPELTLLALGWVAKRTEGEVGVDLLLTPEHREVLCRICLLDPAALDRTMDYMLPTYPEVVREGTTAGVYGRFVRLHKWPEMTDLL